jgi:hypothetical protein
MLKENNCCCVVCQVERSLLNSLSTSTTWQASWSRYLGNSRTTDLCSIAKVHAYTQSGSQRAQLRSFRFRFQKM